MSRSVPLPLPDAPHHGHAHVQPSRQCNLGTWISRCVILMTACIFVAFFAGKNPQTDLNLGANVNVGSRSFNISNNVFLRDGSAVQLISGRWVLSDSI